MTPPGYSGASHNIWRQLEELATSVTLAELNWGATTFKKMCIKNWCIVIY